MSTVPPPPPVSPPPAPTSTPLPAGSVPNHLVWAIIATVFSLCLCCGIPGLITGIVAIVYAAKVNSLLNAGDVEGARRASNTARIWCWVTTALAIIGIVAVIYNLTFGEGIAQYKMMMEQIQAQSGR